MKYRLSVGKVLFCLDAFWLSYLDLKYEKGLRTVHLSSSINPFWRQNKRTKSLRSTYILANSIVLSYITVFTQIKLPSQFFMWIFSHFIWFASEKDYLCVKIKPSTSLKSPLSDAISCSPTIMLKFYNFTDPWKILKDKLWSLSIGLRTVHCKVITDKTCYLNNIRQFIFLIYFV